MGLLSVILAALAAFAFGALWYGALAKPWMQAANIPQDGNGRPKGGQSPALFAFSFVMQLLVAGMMRHIFSLSAITPGSAPLTQASLGCAIMGLTLMLTLI